ncbi:MAG: SDR family oxidoreductase [Novosphingobium sp.]|nr:SDR family oxidoreductase [Novosphingobium sp.]MCP5402859.1 SDR family oxidoreductase [Novosphingobium sp.]
MGKTIVITGAGVGLGRALARRFAKEGETVILLGRTLSKVQAAADELGDPAFAVECDVGSPDSVREAFAKIAERHPRIDVLINNAAIYEPFLVENATDEQIMGIVNTNLSGPIFTSRSAIPMMEKGGYIINVTSESVALEFPMLSLYQCTKAGLERFTGSLSKELETKGIRVSTVRAGPMYEEGKASTWDPEIGMQFGKACMEAGINLMSRPISHVNSVTDVFRSLLDLPPDVRVTHVSIEARHA